MSWLEDILLGALGSGVNHPTLIALNIIMALALGSLVLLLCASFHSHPAMVPHVIVLLVLAVGLWISINWFIANVGMVDVAEQQKELFGDGSGADSKSADSDAVGKVGASAEAVEDAREDAAAAAGGAKEVDMQLGAGQGLAQSKKTQ